MSLRNARCNDKHAICVLHVLNINSKVNLVTISVPVDVQTKAVLEIQRTVHRDTFF